MIIIQSVQLHSSFSGLVSFTVDDNVMVHIPSHLQANQRENGQSLIIRLVVEYC
jgi:hypothetical protein